MPETDLTNAYCRACLRFHAATVLERDEDGFPSKLAWGSPHDSAARDRLGEAAGRALGIAVDIGDLELAEKAAQALSVNDSPDGSA